MNWKHRLALSLTLIIVSGTLATDAAGLYQDRTSGDVACPRSCLDNLMNQYLQAMAAHDPSRLPVAFDVKFTENTAPLKLGEGLWATISGLGSYRLYADDPEMGEVAALVVVNENDVPALLFLRLKVMNGKIAEAESIVVRTVEQSFLDISSLIQPKPIFLEEVPPAERSSRSQMVAIVDKYFDGIEQSNGNMVPFADNVIRVENGIQTCPGTGKTDSGLPPAFSKISCRDQLNSRLFSYIKSIRPRRYVVVDEERGLVFGIFRFNHPGTVKTVDSPGIGTVNERPFTQHPYSCLIAELFKIKDGKIVEISAAFGNLPYREPTGWGD
jgi:hypothetical protein